jgi:SOS-response transcriptional repressor LexA
MDAMQRLVAAVEQSGLKRARIAEDAGMSPTKLSKILNGIQAPLLEDFLAIAHAIHCEPARLLTDGELVIDLATLEEANRLSQRLGEILERWLPPAGSAVPSVPLLAQPKVPANRWIAPVRAAANPNAELIAELESDMKRIPRRAANRGAKIIARVTGDSMDGGDDPLHDGELAYLKPTRSPRAAKGHITLIRREDGLYLKKLEISGRKARLVSANREHPPIEVDLRAENLQVYGYVVDHGAGE